MNVEKFYLQTDKRWKDKKMVGKLSMGDFFCLGTAIQNALNDFYGTDDTPDKLNDYLNANKGYTSKGLLIWGVLESRYRFKQENFTNKNIPKIVNEKNIYYLVQVPYKDTGHFCNVVGFKGEIITYFDPYDGFIKNINVKDIWSFRVLTFY